MLTIRNLQFAVTNWIFSGLVQFPRHPFPYTHGLIRPVGWWIIGMVLILLFNAAVDLYCVRPLFYCRADSVCVVWMLVCYWIISGVRFTNGKSAFSYLVKSRGGEIDSRISWMALKFYGRLRRITAEPPVKFQSHLIIRKTNLACSRLDEIWESQLTFR